LGYKRKWEDNIKIVLFKLYYGVDFLFGSGQGPVAGNSFTTEQLSAFKDDSAAENWLVIFVVVAMG
jgi:hypothetical protein